MKKFLIIMTAIGFASCTIETDVTTNTVIRNSSNHTITFTVYGPHTNVKTFNLESGAEAIESRIDMGSSEIFLMSADSVYIVYNDSITNKYYNNSQASAGTKSPFNVYSYDLTSEESRHSVKNTYIYNIIDAYFKLK